MNRILLITVLLVFCAGIGLSNAELYKWVDKDGVEHFSNSKPEISPDTPVETEAEIPFDAAADAERQQQDNKVMEAVNSEKTRIESDNKLAEEQPLQPEAPAPEVVEENDDDHDNSGGYYVDDNPRIEHHQFLKKRDDVVNIQQEVRPKNAAHGKRAR